MAGIPGNELAYNTESMETDVSSWGSLANSTIAQSTAFALEGTHSMSITSTASGIASALPISADFPAAVVGNTYQFSFWVYSTVAGLQVTGNQFDWYNGVTFVHAGVSVTVNLAQNAWTQVLVTGVAPATTTLARIYPSFTATAGGQVCYIDEVYFGPPITTTVPVYQPGSKTWRRRFRHPQVATPHPPPPTWSLVQQSSAQATGGICTLPTGSTAGNLLVLTASNGSSTALVAPTGATWSTLRSVINGTSSQDVIFACFNNPGGLSSFTVTGGSGAIQCEVYEFTCPNVAQVTTASDGGTQTGGAVAAITISSGSAAQTGDLVVVSGFEHLTATSAITWTTPSGFTDGSSLSVASATNHQYSGYQVAATSGGIQAVTVTSSVATTSSTGWTGCVTTFSLPSSSTVSVTATLNGVGTAGAVPIISDPSPTLNGQGTAGAVPDISDPSPSLIGQGTAGPVVPDIGVFGPVSGRGTASAGLAIGGGGSMGGSGGSGSGVIIGVFAVLSGQGGAGASAQAIWMATAALQGTGTAGIVPDIDAPASVAGGGSDSAQPTIGVPAAAAGSGGMGGGPAIGAGATATGTGTAGSGVIISVSASVIGAGGMSGQSSGSGNQGALVGQGTDTATAIIGVLATVSGLGTATTQPIISVTAVLAGAGSAGATPGLRIAATLAGAGTAGPVVPDIDTPANVAGLGTANAGLALGGSGGMGGSGSAGSGVIISVSASVTGSGGMSGQGSGASAAGALTGQGTAGAVPDIDTPANLAGQGTASAGLALGGGGGLGGNGSAGSGVIISVSASLTGQGGMGTAGGGSSGTLVGTGTASATATVISPASAILSGHGGTGLVVPDIGVFGVLGNSSQAQAVATLRVLAAMAGLGTVTGTAAAHFPNVPGTGKPTVTDPRDGVHTVAPLAAGKTVITDPRDGKSSVAAAATGKSTVAQSGSA
jgi:hypothetical protein